MHFTKVLRTSEGAEGAANVARAAAEVVLSRGTKPRPTQGWPTSEHSTPVSRRDAFFSPVSFFFAKASRDQTNEETKNSTDRRTKSNSVPCSTTGTTPVIQWDVSLVRAAKPFKGLFSVLLKPPSALMHHKSHTLSFYKKEKEKENSKKLDAFITHTTFQTNLQLL